MKRSGGRRCCCRENTKLERPCLSCSEMLISLPPLPPFIIIEILVSIILGLILRSYRGSISESSIFVRLGLLTILATAVGVTIFSFYVMLSLHVMPLVIIIVGAVSILVGMPFMFCQERKEIEMETSDLLIAP